MRDKLLTRREFVLASASLAATGTAAKVMASTSADAGVHVWEKHELEFTCEREYANAYTDATVWVDLTGPGFKKRVYGFWDGGKTFKVRVTATAPGVWRWHSGCEPDDSGLAGKSGSFTAVEWTETEKQVNQLRGGFLRPSANHHALETADGTPFFVQGDTWWALGTNRFRWYNDEIDRPLGPTAGFKDYVRFRKSQGYNWLNMIVAWPNWENDGLPAHLLTEDKLTVRNAWVEFGTGSAKNMDNEGGRPFLFPGKVPGFEKVFADVDRVNPEYFKYVDRKIDYLNANGIVPFIEISRRDASEMWKKYYKWPDSYARFIQYIWARYQANNTVLSPIHLDVIAESIPVPDYMQAINLVMKKYGPPPFGTLLSANANPSTLTNWGDDSWVTLHQLGNAREHQYYWYMTDIFHQANPKPALNGEPYYPGWNPGGHAGPERTAPAGTPKDDQYVRSGMYGSFLSGGLAGHIYGAEGIWNANIESAAPVKMWEGFQFKSGAQMQHLRTFAFSIGKRYQELEPDAGLVFPNSTRNGLSYEGWAYAARTPDRHIFLVYFENDCPRSFVRGALPMSIYRARWFDPRQGIWQDAGEGTLQADKTGETQLPALPGELDWGLSLVYQSPAPMPDHF